MFAVLNQPAEGTFLDLLTAQIEKNEFRAFGSLSILVAYVKTSGVARLAPFINRLRQVGGTVLVVAGVDQTNTSYEGLEQLLKLGADVWIFHDENWTATFHPKVYFLEGKRGSWLAVGSNNLTAGGLMTNYEATAVTETTDESLLSRTKAVFSRYRDESGDHAKRLTPALLKDLLDNGYVKEERRLISERLERERRDSRSSDRLFPRSARPEPPSQRLPRKHFAGRKPALSVLRGGFYKSLSKYDASRTSSPGQIIIPIGFKKHLPPLGEPELTESGATQSEAYFDVLFVDAAGSETLVKNARAILYVPAPDHPRQNIELRFTFRDRTISDKLSKDDVLVFTHTNDPRIVLRIEHVLRREAGKRFGDRYGEIQGERE